MIFLFFNRIPLSLVGFDKDLFILKGLVGPEYGCEVRLPLIFTYIYEFLIE